MECLAQHKLQQHKREQRGNVGRLAEQLGVTQAAVSMLITGRSSPSLEMQRKLWELGICEPNDWLLPAPDGGAANVDQAA